MKDENDANTLQTTATSLDILDLLDESSGARVSEIAEQMEMPKSTVHGHLATLRSKRFVIKRGDIYYLGPELLRLGNHVRTRKEGFILARKYTEQLFEEVGLRSAFAVEMGGRAVFVHTASGDKMGWAHESLGNPVYLHSTAVGKAILAATPRTKTERILDRWGMPAETEHTITDREEFFGELEAVRDRGYATNHQENFEGLYAIGKSATEPSGKVIGGFTITGPEQSFVGGDREQQLVEGITEVVNEYELELSLA